MFGSKRRQEIYDRIRASSKEEVILDEMIRLGFWKSGSGHSSMTEDWLRRHGELKRELRELSKKQARFDDTQAMLAEIRQKKMTEARKRRAETKQRREEERAQKAAAWQGQKDTDIVYLGAGVSGGLNGATAKEELQLTTYGLPAFPSVKALAQSMGLNVGELRFLTYHRDVSKTTHYRRFFVPKKTGGQRLISAPMPRLKAAQYWILEQLLYRVPVHAAAHGFVRERSIVTNAKVHLGRDLVVNLDLKDFFPTVTFPRAKGLFFSLGYSEKIATLLALLCTEPDVEQIELDGEHWFVHSSQRQLPQGAPTSPAITNILCRKFDARMAGIAKSLGFDYTRYADDVTFSASGSAAENFKQLLWRAKAVINDENFTMHPDKLRIMRKGGRQEVTGLVVNDKLAVPRRDLRRFRALLFQIEKDGGVDGKRWRGEGRLLARIKGYANFIHMVDEEKGAPFVDQVNRILERHGWQPEIRHPSKRTFQSESNEQPTGNRGAISRILRKLRFWAKG